MLDAATLTLSCLAAAFVGAMVAFVSTLTNPTNGAAFGALVGFFLWVEWKLE